MGASINRIPAGSMIEIFNRVGNPVASGALLEEWVISVSSEYKAFLSDAAPDALNWTGGALAQISNGRLGFSGQFKQFGACGWVGTDIAVFNFSLEFHMTYSGWEEVVQPVERIKRLVVPAERNDNSGMLISPGPTILDALGVIDYTSPRSHAPAPSEITVPDSNNYSSDDSLLSVRVGNLIFDRLIMKSAETSFLRDKDDQGNPIGARIAIVMQTLYVPSKKEMASWFQM